MQRAALSNTPYLPFHNLNLKCSPFMVCGNYQVKSEDSMLYTGEIGGWWNSIYTLNVPRARTKLNSGDKFESTPSQSMVA